jgi:uncharacterized membrane protein YbaN (DUF454 family)
MKGSSRITKPIFAIMGTLFLGLGAIGIFLPLLPTTPFLLLAAACYLRGSERLHNWMMHNRVFGEFIKNYLGGKGISLRHKTFTLMLLWLMISYSILYMMENLVLQTFVFLIALAVSFHIITLPTFEESPQRGK